MKKAVNLILAILCFFCFGLRANAADSLVGRSEPDTDGIEVVQIADGHERVCMEGIVIDDITTENYRKIVTQSDEGISEYYEDYSMGIAVLTLNGHVVEIYDIEEIRKQSERSWHRFDSEGIVWGIAILFGAALVAGGVWSCVPGKK